MFSSGRGVPLTMFQSAPRSEERGDDFDSANLLSDWVSIRAPLRRAGRCLYAARIMRRYKFQSAPRSEERGDLALGTSAAPQDVSIRAPLRRAGRCRKQRRIRSEIDVSIRAPLRRAGRYCASNCANLRRCFNPRPAPKSGAMRSAPLSASLPAFQSAPRSEERGDCAPVDKLLFERVSIRAPLRRAGRYRLSADRLACTMFQSAPRSEERGDFAERRGSATPGGFNPRPAPKSGAILGARDAVGNVVVSIRAPLRRAGRCAPTPRAAASRSFQSAPRSEERGDSRSRAPTADIASFNPRPAPKSGAIRADDARAELAHVSIRAPLRRAGRYSTKILSPEHRRFQSAPRSEERGDTIPRQAPTVSPSFQSAPRSEERGDARRRPCSVDRPRFNPRPAPKSGAMALRF